MLDSKPTPLATLWAFAALRHAQGDDTADRLARAQRGLLRLAQRSVHALTSADAPSLQNAPADLAAALFVALSSDLRGAARQATLAAVARAPEAIQYVAKRAWDALDDQERAALAHAAAQHADAACASALLTRLGVAGLHALDDRDRAALVTIAASDPDAAASVITAMAADGLAALHAAPQTAPLAEELLAAVRRDAYYVARVIGGFGADGIMALLADPHTEPLAVDLLAEVSDSAYFASVIIAALGANGFAALHADPRTAPYARDLLAAVRGDASAAARVIETLGADGVAALRADPHTAPLARDLLNAVQSDAYAAALAITGLDATGLAALDAQQRRALLLSVGNDHDAVRVIEKWVLKGGAGASDDERRTLRTVLTGPDASLAAAHAIAQGAPWRDWMMDFAPDAQAPADAKDAWRDIIAYLTPDVQHAVMRRMEPSVTRSALRCTR